MHDPSAKAYHDIVIETERSFRTVTLIHSIFSVRSVERDRDVLKDAINKIRTTVADGLFICLFNNFLMCIFEGIDWKTTAKTTMEEETTILRVLASRACLFGDRVATESVVSLLNLVFHSETGISHDQIDAVSNHPNTPLQNRGCTALAVAAAKGNHTMVKWLLFHGSCPNVRNEIGMPLFFILSLSLLYLLFFQQVIRLSCGRVLLDIPTSSQPCSRRTGITKSIWMRKI